MAIHSSAQKFNSKQPRNSFVKMSLQVKGGTKRTHVIPAQAAEEMQLDIKCEECDSRFAVVGSAFFCPACGHNSVVRTYNDSLNKIRIKKDNIPAVKTALIEASGKDEAEITCRSLLETCISDGVVAFQKYCEGLYSDYGNPPFNAFQRLEQGSELWKNAVQKGYNDWLEESELRDLNILFQKRHILSHNEGIVDSKYISKSGDQSYKEGQRIVISNNDVDALLNCLNKLGQALERACNDS